MRTPHAKWGDALKSLLTDRGLPYTEQAEKLDNMDSTQILTRCAWRILLKQ